MTPDELAALHARAAHDPWSAQSFVEMMAAKGAILICEPHCFALGRLTLDEAELLQIATDPDARRQGLARRVLTSFEAAAKNQGGTRAFLEVARSNAPARALYLANDWYENGVRRGYYRLADGTHEDAILMSKLL